MLGLGFEKILEAENGQQALELFQKEPTDLLLTDLHMPVMDGHQLLKEMAARGLFGKVKVGVVTAEPNLDIHRELLALGAKWVIQKPFTPEMFRQGIQNILA